MQTVFLELVKLSLIGSLFAAAVMLVRLVFRKAPKWLFCVLWGVVALRLICPVSIESNVSLIPDRLASGQIITNVGNEYIGDVDIIYESNASYSNAVEAGRQPVYSNDGYYVVTEKDSLEAPKTVGETVYPILSWIWVAGVVLMLAYTAVSYFLLRKKMEEATQLRDNIWQCEQVDSPFVLGFLKPRIYLPYAITDSDMANVIAHEQAHIQRKDHWWKPIGFLLLSIHWFNPVLWLAYILLCRDIEAACDEKVIKHMEKDEMRAYSTALLHCSVHRRRIAACPLAFGETGVKERIKRVMNYKKPAFWIIISAVVLCSVVAVCFLTTPAASSEFAMNGNNVSDLNVDEIITHIRKVQRLGDGNAYTNPGNFSLTIDSDFNWVGSQAVRYFFYKEHGVHSAQVRIFSDEEKVFLTESSEWLEQDQVFLLRHYLDAVKYLPQDEISQMAPADKYLIRHVAEGRPSSYSRVITYTPNGAENTDDWLIHLQLEPLHAAEEGYVGTGEEVIHLFYADKTDTVGDISKLLALVNSIANNPDCAASSNPFTFIEAKKPLYNEILTYGSVAVDFFVEQLRTGENGLQGYIMAVACADITGIGDKDLGADWATAQEWLALYDKKASNIASIHSQIYAVKEVTYESGVYNFTIVAGENSPFYVLAEDMELASQKEVSEEGTWTNLGKMEAIELSKENFDDLFSHPGNWVDNADAKSIRDNTQKAWQLIYNQDVLYYILQQKNGDLYLAYGYTGYSNNDANAAHIRWLYKLSVERSAHAGMVATSGHNAVPMISIPKGTPIKDCLDAIHWLTINPFGDDLVPFNTAENGMVIYGKYSAYDAETFESLKHFLPSGLSPQTYLFQNADSEREYVVLADFGDKGNYAFGVRFGNENSALESLKRSVPEYFNLNHSKGLDVYVWQMANNHYSFGLMPHSETQRDWISEDLMNLKGITAEEMRLILSTYGIPQDEIYVIPWQNPLSSYIGEYWIITDGEDIEQKRNAYVQNLRDMLFSQQ